MATKHYRRQVEVLRDFLDAAKTETCKTRLMNRANLNRSSFSHYLSYCIDNQLLLTTTGGYVATPRAQERLQRLEQVLQREAEFRSALEGLRQVTRSGAYAPRSPPESVEALNRLEFPAIGIELMTTRWRDRDRVRD